MEHLNRLSGYFADKERKRLDAIVRESRSGLPEMTVDEIRLSCVQNNGYETPELNEKLYLHFRGFKRIENLDNYTGCKALWLDSNGFDTIENLGALEQLRCLYLSKNIITQISGLSSLTELVILDLSNNRISRVENLSCCPQLETVNLGRNSLSSAESIEHFRECLSLKNIDVTNNRLIADEAVLEILQQIPALVALSINGNEVTKLAHFRKRTISSMPNLGYLDRPIDEQERYAANAFRESGVEGEAAARDAWRALQKEKKANEMAVFRAWQAEQQELRAQARTEGRLLHSISEFTPEEQEERQRLAEKAAEDEKRMLSLGIDKLGSRFWQLDGRAGSNRAGVDLLEEATRQLINEDELSKSGGSSSGGGAGVEGATSSRVEELNEEDDSVDGKKSDTITVTPKIVDTATRIQIVDEDEEEEEVGGPCLGGSRLDAEYPPELPLRHSSHPLSLPTDVTPEQHITAAVSSEPDALQLPPAPPTPTVVEEDLVRPPGSSPLPEPPKVLTAEERKRAQAEERERQDRVADSMRIYKQQLAAEKKLRDEKERRYSSHSSVPSSPTDGYGGDHSDSFTPTHTTLSSLAHAATGGSMPRSNTWGAEAPLALTGNDQHSKATFYWTEIMDLRLAQEVRMCVFDFDTIASKMHDAAAQGALKSPSSTRFVKGLTIRADPSPEMFTAEACRLRWAELDADQWSKMSPETSALDTVYKICIQPEVLSASHGGQPTFQALASIAAGSMPAYLKPPSSFPSVRDLDEEDDDADDVVPGDVDAEITIRDVTGRSAFGDVVAVDESEDDIMEEEAEEEEEDEGSIVGRISMGSAAEEEKHGGGAPAVATVSDTLLDELD